MRYDLCLLVSLYALILIAFILFREYYRFYQLKYAYVMIIDRYTEAL
jgi:hypothetical protein